MPQRQRRSRNPVPPTYKGGRTYLDSLGYVMEMEPTHPACGQNGYVRQHRLVAEATLGRYLYGTEIVHHRNGQKADNRPDNLEVLATRREHATIHVPELRVLNRAPLEEDRVRELLRETRSLSRAAAILDVHSQTLRNRFPELVAEHTRAAPGFLDADALATCEFAMAAQDQFEALRIVAAKHRCCVQSVKNALLRWSKQGGQLGELASQVSARLRSRGGPKRKASRRAYVRGSLA